MQTAISAAVVALCAFSPALAAPRYTITDLGGYASSQAEAFSINNNGLIAGRGSFNGAWMGDDGGFLWRPDVGLSDLPGLVDLYVGGAWLNDSGQFAVIWYDDETWTATIQDEPPFARPVAKSSFWNGATMQRLPSLGGHCVEARRVNRAGQVVGRAQTSALDDWGWPVYRAFLWDAQGGMHDLGTLGGPDSEAVAINNAGCVLGTSATDASGTGANVFLWRPETGMVDLQQLGAGHARPSGLNDQGQIAGLGSNATGLWDVPFLWDPVAGLTWLPTLGDNMTSVSAMNNLGQIVGSGHLTYDATDETTWSRRALLWSEGVLQDLNNLISDETWMLEEATDINDVGQIVGHGRRFGGQVHAFLLTPVPEPCAFLLVVCGCALFVGRRARSLVTAGVLVLGASQLSAEVRYSLTDLGTLGGLTSSALAINDSGQVVGGASAWTTPLEVHNHAFLWQNGHLQDLVGADSGAADINNLGVVVGMLELPGQHIDGGFQWAAAGGLQRLEEGDWQLWPMRINDAGQWLGMACAEKEDSPSRRSVYFDPVLGLRDIEDFLPAGFDPNDLNNGGWLVGTYQAPGESTQQAALWDGRSLALITSGSGDGINDAGHIIGSHWSEADRASRAFIWDGKGDVRDLGGLGAPGPFSTMAEAINELDQVVGISKAETSRQHAFIWQDGIMQDLNALIPSDSGFELGWAYDINNHGQIVGVGVVGGFEHAFLLTPIPEPSALMLLVSAAAFGACSRLRPRH